MNTPAGISSLCNASTVFCVGAITSISLLWVLCSNCSLESLYLWTALRMVITCFSVGRGIGPDTSAPVFLAVSTILAADWSRALWSYAFNLILIFWLLSVCSSLVFVRFRYAVRGLPRLFFQVFTAVRRFVSDRSRSLGFESKHVSVCFIIFYSKQKREIPSPGSWPDSSRQKLPDSSATSCFIALI